MNKLQPVFAGVAALALIGIVGYLTATGEQVGEALTLGLGMAMGYLFGRDDIDLPTSRKE